MTRTNGHPIKWHSTPPNANYHQMPNKVTRDNTLGNNGYRVLGILYSHIEGWEVSANRIAKEMGWGWRRAESGLKELEQSRYLVIQKVVTAKGTAVSAVYHIKLDGSRFSDQDVAQLSTPHVLPGPPVKRQNPLIQTGIHPSAETAVPPLSERQNKEDQIKHQLEDQTEDQQSQVLPLPPAGDSCVFCRRGGSDAETLPVENLGGNAHEACLIQWMFEDPAGIDEFFRLSLSGTEKQQRALASAQERYWEMKEMGLLPVMKPTRLTTLSKQAPNT